MKARGVGTIYQPTYKNKKTGEYKKSGVWWVQYCVRGQVKRESSESTHRVDAVKLLRRRLGEIGKGRSNGRDIERKTFDDLSEALLNDYRINNRESLDRLELSLKHLREAFGMMRLIHTGDESILGYKTRRQEEGAANATINRELAALKRGFRLCKVPPPRLRSLLKTTSGRDSSNGSNSRAC
jgi:hypothetical protein